MTTGTSFRVPSKKFGLDPTGMPIIEHRPLQICHIPGGGMWGVKSSIMMDFITDLTGQPFAHHYDAYTAVSVGSILAAGILLPERLGSDEPLHPDFRDIRRKMVADGRDIFPDKKARSFFTRRLWREISLALCRYGVEQSRYLTTSYIDSIGQLSNIFAATSQQEKETTEKNKTLLSAIKQASAMSLCLLFNFVSGMPPINASYSLERFRQTQDRAASKLYEEQKKWLNAQADLTEDKIHFKGHVLFEKLRENLRAPRADDRDDLAPVMLRQMVAPLVVPAISTTGNQNGYVRFVRAPVFGQSDRLRARLRPWFIEQHSTAHAVDASSRQPTMFTTTSDTHTGYDYSDGGSFYDAQRATWDTLEFWSRDQAFFTTVYECNMGDRPPMISSVDLNRSHLTATVAKTLSLNARASRQAHNLDIEGHPNAYGFAEFKRPVYFDAPDLPENSVTRQAMVSFCDRFINRRLEECLQTKIPDPMDTLTQASSKPDVISLFEAAAIQAIVRNLPEMVYHAKYLVLRGPLSDRLTTDQTNGILSTIDARFPPHELQAIESGRQWDAKITPQDMPFYMHKNEQALFDRRMRALCVKKNGPERQVLPDPMLVAK